jgi:hypothetical protein
MTIVGGTQEYSMRANWKLLTENSIDGYHALTTQAPAIRLRTVQFLHVGLKTCRHGPAQLLRGIKRWISD